VNKYTGSVEQVPIGDDYDNIDNLYINGFLYELSTGSQNIFDVERGEFYNHEIGWFSPDPEDSEEIDVLNDPLTIYLPSKSTITETLEDKGIYEFIIDECNKIVMMKSDYKIISS
jgi:hypothetical protein